MDVTKADGEVLGALSERERASMAAVMGFLTVPVVLLLVIDTLRYRALIALLPFVVAVPLTAFALMAARDVYRESGYLRVDRGVQVAAGAVPATTLLLYIISRGVGQSPTFSVVLSVALTALAAYVAHRAIASEFGEDAHYRVEGDWIAYYRDDEAVKEAHSSREFDRDEQISFGTLYVFLGVVLGLMLNINLTATTTEEQVYAFILSAATILVPFLTTVAIRAVEFDTYAESQSDLAVRLAVPFLYGFVAVFMMATLVFGYSLAASVVAAALAFFPFVVFTTIVCAFVKPSLFDGSVIPGA